MPVLTNVILPWNGTHATIPTGWIRATNFDGKVKKAWGAEAVAVNGGSDTHTHASSAHTHNPTDSHGHYVTYAQDNTCAVYGWPDPWNNDDITNCGHSHADSTITTKTGGTAVSTVAYPSTPLNNLPPFHEVIYLKGVIGASLKVNHLIYHARNEIPAGWQIPDGTNGFPDIRNRYLRGAGTGANAGTQAGALTHTHDLSHTHSTTHGHTGQSGTSTNTSNQRNGGGNGGNKTNRHSHAVYLNDATVSTDTYTGSVTSGTVEPEYYKLLTLINKGAGSWKKGMIAMFEDDISLLPPGWLVCDGRAWTDGLHSTPDLRNKFIKVALNGTEIGNTGGSNTHSHSASNAHAHSQSGAHSHSGYTDSQGGNTHSGPGGSSPAGHGHGLSSVGNNNATLTWDSQTMTGESVSNQPAYRTTYFIQLEKLGGGSIMLNFV